MADPPIAVTTVTAYIWKDPATGNELCLDPREVTVVRQEQPMTTVEYGGITLRATMPVVLEAPQRTLLTAGMFASEYGASPYIDGDLVCVGQTRTGEQVWYKITGWDAEQKALILERHYRG